VRNNENTLVVFIVNECNVSFNILQNICFTGETQHLLQWPMLFPLYTAAATMSFASI
jgi:hypothetical protein